MENSLRRSPVLGGVVQDAIPCPVTVENVRVKFVAVDRQRKDASDAMAVEDKGIVREADRFRGIIEILVEPVLDPPIHWRKIIGEQTVRFPLMSKEGMHHFSPLVMRVRRVAVRWQAERRETE